MQFRLNGEITNIHSAAFLLGAAGLLSRLLGILRDRMLAANFGAGRELDIYFAAFQIPDLVSVVFLLGAGSAAILPVFQEYLSKDKEKAQTLISQLFFLFICGSVLLMLIAFFLTPYFMHLVTPGFSAPDRALTVTLTRIMLLSPILLGLSSIFSAVVQSFQRFLAYAIAPVLYNLGIIVGILFLVPIWGMSGLALGVILGAFWHFVLQFWAGYQLGFTPRFRVLKNPFSKGALMVLKLAFPRVLSISVSRLTVLVLVAIGSTLAAGSIAVWQLAQNLFFVPVGIFGVSYAVALFPKLSRSYINKNAQLFFQEFFLGIRTILFWIMPTAVIFIVLRAHIIRAALGAGVFSWEDTRLSAAVLAALTIAMLAEGLTSLLIKSYYALENTWRPLVINIGASVVSVALAFWFSRLLATASPVRELLTGMFRIADLPNPEVLGLALGFSLGLLLNILFLYFSLQRLAERTFKVCEHYPLMTLLKITLAASIAGVAAYAVRVSFSETLPLITLARVLGQGIIAGLAGFGVYFGVLILLKAEEMSWLITAIRRRMIKAKVLPAHWNGETIHPSQSI